jgi:hypothetical protein
LPHDTDKVSAQDFMRSFLRDMKASTSKASKAGQFQYYLVSRSEVDVWNKALDAATNADMDASTSRWRHGTWHKRSYMLKFRCERKYNSM